MHTLFTNLFIYSIYKTMFYIFTKLLTYFYLKQFIIYLSIIYLTIYCLSIYQLFS